MLLLFAIGMSTMKENKEKEAIGEESCPEAQSQARSLAGDKRGLYLKTLIWEISPADKAKRLSMGHPKQSSPTFLCLNNPSKYMMWTRPLLLRPLRLRLLCPRQLCHPHPSFHNSSLQTLLKMKTWLGNVFRKLF